MANVKRRRIKTKTMSHISTAVVPQAAFIAVPTVPVPSHADPSTGAPLMGALMNSTVISRMFGSPVPSADADTEPGSVLEYTLMTDNGSLTIPFEKINKSKDESKELGITEELLEQSKDVPNYAQITNKQASMEFSDQYFEETLYIRSFPFSDPKETEEDVVARIETIESEAMFPQQTESSIEEELLHEKQTKPVATEPDRSREQQLKEEIMNLRDMVYRLNRELSKYQAKYGSAEVLNQCQTIVGLPTEGPIPSWLISMKYLSPLVLEYEEQIKQLETNVATYKEEFENVSKNCKEIVDENQVLHEKMDKLTSCASHVLEKSLAEQRLDLILEENHILLEQLKIEKSKNKDTSFKLSKEVQQLKDQLKSKNEQVTKLEVDLQEEKTRAHELKTALDEMRSKDETKIEFIDHKNSLAKLQKDIEESMEKHIKEKAEINARLQASYQEEQRLRDLQAHCKDKIERMHKDMKSLKVTKREYAAKNHKLIEILKMTQNRENVSQDQLKKLKANEEIVQKLINKNSQRDEKQKKMKTTVKIYKKKLSEELLAKKEVVNNLQQDFQLQIRQLYSALKHKDNLLQISEADKQQMEDDMETLWQAAQSENVLMHRILNGICCEDNQTNDDSNDEIILYDT